MPDIFLSYSREDQAVARRFAEALQLEGFEVWWDQALNAGEAFDQVTERALEKAKAVVVLWSRISVDSRWVRAEATQAHANNRLVPVMIEACKRPIMFELTHSAELSEWKGNRDDPAWQSFAFGLRRFIGRTAAHEPAEAAGSVLRSTSSPGFGVRRASILVTGLLVIGAVCAWWYHGNESLQGNAHRPSAIANYIAAPVTIAVLPFANLSSNPAQESFSDGLTEEILNELAQITSLSVIGRTSSFSFKGKNVDLRVIGQQLGVANLLEGSVRREGDTLRISAKLISSDSGTQLWSRSYEREMRGVFALQQEVAQDVARALQVRLDVGEMSRARGGTTNVDAYEKYLRSTQLYRHDGSKDIAESAGLLREALALDPDFLLAWIVRAAVATTELGWGIGDPQTTLRELSEAQRRILTLAPASPAAAGIRVTELAAQRKWGEALKAIGDGTANRLELTSISSAISQSDPVQMLLRSVGRANEAYALSRKLSRLDPLNLMLSANLQWDLGVTSQTEAVQTEYERSSALVGDHGRVDHFALARALNRREQDMRSAERQFDLYLKNETLPMSFTRELRTLLRNPEAARALIRKALDVPDNRQPLKQFFIALYADSFGDLDTTLRGLRNSAFLELDERSPWLPLLWFQFQTPVRTEPRFKEMVRDLGLVDYWRTSGNWGDFCRPTGGEDFECFDKIKVQPAHL